MNRACLGIVEKRSLLARRNLDALEPLELLLGKTGRVRQYRAQVLAVAIIDRAGRRVVLGVNAPEHMQHEELALGPNGQSLRAVYAPWIVADHPDETWLEPQAHPGPEGPALRRLAQVVAQVP